MRARKGWCHENMAFKHIKYRGYQKVLQKIAVGTVGTIKFLANIAIGTLGTIKILANTAIDTVRGYHTFLGNIAFGTVGSNNSVVRRVSSKNFQHLCCFDFRE